MTTSVLKMQRELVAVTEERDRLADELAKLRAAPAVPVSVLTIFERLRDDLLAAHADAHDSMHRALLQSAEGRSSQAKNEVRHD